jgi:carbon monoxide dehydrogenase subunit G
VQRVVTADLQHEASRVYPVLRDLESYDAWMPLVHRVEADGDGWFVTLRAKVGPLARSKRLRMTCLIDQPDTHVRFERSELDGKDHSAWVMDATVSDGVAEGTSLVRIELRYEGGLWSTALDALLGSSIEDAVEGLRRQVADA